MNIPSNRFFLLRSQSAINMENISIIGNTNFYGVIIDFYINKIVADLVFRNFKLKNNQGYF